ncbi:hypothetical protein LSH36_246g02047 [Paralvinella palmiformis]|uniref:Uncharacterized protein n=1 Tax=Paralvinella palmiformis TaxID=53620 RepID=A0AAD9N3C2_9ANNE|nr:hypothetical protein LSH36_246g02047 [Paralvinella palmiformis]
MLLKVLQTRGFECYRVDPISSICVTVEVPTFKKDVVYNENLEIQEMYETSLNVSLVEYIRKKRTIPGQERQETNGRYIYIYIRLRARRYSSDLNQNSLLFITNSDDPLIVLDADQPPSDSDDMPLFKPHPTFIDNVKFMRQWKTTTYRYPYSMVAQNPDHFTAYVKVEVSEIREYDLRRRKRNKFRSATIILSTLPPFTLS